MGIFLLFYLVLIPIFVLFHEIGHGIGVISSSKSRARVYLGRRHSSNKENFRLGRLHFHINWSHFGFCDWDGKLEKRQRIAAFIGGPIASLLLTILFGLLCMVVPEGEVRTLVLGSAIFNFLQFFLTIIPITYPKWWGAYRGLSSDGLLLLRLIRDDR